MIIGDQRRWWNSHVPILRIGAFFGVVLLGFLVWVFCGDFIQTAVWSVYHQRTAKFRGQTLQVPWFWQEEVWTNYNEFQLSRSRLLWPISSTSVTVLYENLSPTDLQKEIDAMRALDAKLTHHPGDYFDPDASINPHFVCTDNGSSRSEFEWIICFSWDGRWSVRMLGQKQDRSDFASILRGVDAMGTPSK